MWRCPASPSWQTYFAGARKRVSRRSFRNTSRGTWRSVLARLRFRKHELQPATLVLLASRWASEVHQNRSIGEAVADASKPETCLGGVEVSEFYNQPEHFIFPSERLKGSKPLDLASVLKKARSNLRSRGSASQAWAGTLIGTRLGPCWRRWANTRSQSATTCGTATFMSRTSTCRRHRRPNAWQRTSWSTRFCHGYFAEDEPTPMNAVCERFRMGLFY